MKHIIPINFQDWLSEPVVDIKLIASKQVENKLGPSGAIPSERVIPVLSKPIKSNKQRK